MTVLVGFDGSASSMVALRWAGAYAAAHDDELDVVRTWQYPASVPIQVPTPERLRPADDIDATIAAEVRDVLAAELPGVRASVTVRRGAPAEQLIERTSDPSVRALVLGSRGLGGFSKLLLGSVTRACLEHSRAPVVVVRRDRPQGVRRVLVGVDGSDGSRAALRWACDAACAFGAELVAVTVAEPDQAELWTDVVERLHARSELDLSEWCSEEATSIRQRRLVLDGDPRTALLDAADQEAADLVVVGSRGLGPMRRLLLGSVSSALADLVEVPVVIVPAGRAT